MIHLVALDEETDHGTEVLKAHVWINDQAQETLVATRFAKLV